MKRLIIVVTIVVITSIFFFRPVCKQIAIEDVKTFSPAIEQRQNERGMLYKTWKMKEGNWYQCKTFIERLFFF